LSSPSRHVSTQLPFKQNFASTQCKSDLHSLLNVGANRDNVSSLSFNDNDEDDDSDEFCEFIWFSSRMRRRKSMRLTCLLNFSNSFKLESFIWNFVSVFKSFLALFNKKKKRNENCWVRPRFCLSIFWRNSFRSWCSKC